MNWDQIEGNWKQFTGKVKEKWGKLTDDDLTASAGKRDQLAPTLARSSTRATYTAFHGLPRRVVWPSALSLSAIWRRDRPSPTHEIIPVSLVLMPICGPNP